MDVKITIPEIAGIDERYASRFLAAKLYETGKLSLGQAAEMVGMSKVAFAEILQDFGVSLINYPISEIKRDANRI